jgi:ankyrin repeat protein
MIKENVMKILARIIIISHFVFVNAVLAVDFCQLHTAAAEGKLKKVIELIEEYNFDIDKQDKSLGMTALHYALLNEQCEVAKYLIKKGARTDLIAAFYEVTAAGLISSGCCQGQL